MIRFVDLTRAYWLVPDVDNPKACAFLDTVTDRFVQAPDGTHVFDSLEDIESERLRTLVPEGFWQ